MAKNDEIRPTADVVQETVDFHDGHPGVRAEFLAMLNDPDRFGISEELWPQTQEERQLLVEHMDSLEPLDLSSDEWDALEKDRLAEKEQQQELMRKNWEETDGSFK